MVCFEKRIKKFKPHNCTKINKPINYKLKLNTIVSKFVLPSSFLNTFITKFIFNTPTLAIKAIR